ncbi:MAG: hypothetical protein A3G49_02325 [Candidatus Sungbacteria bacterium RIFCSPLOWO2_12_FULL_41_11]|uniref:Uncharacterized protein n=1 Tax=Candidatus Sungbacteria bacterium RIFCSPLOWO2_12_FULL_41_11 TaxID=1802286 RepID=A0A1G2LNH8_9BACT|nr:MAG: hypothetical protein UV01_C0004G0055 [Parcubacteria group bacterium GW2011_GWA2_42_14]OGZ99261.1 MAG: hypothetical protein A3D41_02980 [Candidatus Sungbacteria bacterium RIFCSPHIGHO2_02_FULL_41_12b]OHA13177.1 MAG: hypothetical protein A3G49_02325 [Candidatus Sungbacteria bacterium RIFCSPLOWO2_12_FULL_41_11]
MEQYWMPKKLDFKNLKLCLDKYPVDLLYIRLVGSMGGTVKVNKKLEGRTLTFKKNKSGLHLFIDSSEVFHFLLNDYQKGFSLAYERIEPTEDGVGKMVILNRGIDPYDPALPEPERSFLRIVLDDHLMEIFFEGRVNIKFHSWWIKPHWKYWTVDKPNNIQESILKQQIEYDEEDS